MHSAIRLHQSASQPALRALAAGLLLLLLGLPVSAQNAPANPNTPDANQPTAEPAAQPAVQPTTTSSENVVKMEAFHVNAGYAVSLQADAQAKQSNSAIVEVITAEDVGKLPDISIADSLTRVTGLAAQRTNGRSQQISIRGLTGDFSTGMLNGREQVSSGENRSVEYDQYPTELLDQVIVYKTAAADLTSQGLAGTVDLRTVLPLSKGARTIAVGGYYQWTQYGDLTPGASRTGERVNASYIDQYGDGKFGLALGFAYTVTPWEGKQFQAWGYPTDSAGNFIMGGTKSYVRSSNLKRTGMMGVFEVKPDENTHMVVDMYYSSFEEKQLLRGMEIPMAFWGDATLQPGYTVTNGLITDYTLTGVHPVVRNDTFKRTDSPFSIGYNLQVGLKSEWPVTFDAGYSRINRTDVNLETWSGFGFNKPAGRSDTMTVKEIPGQVPVIHSTFDYSTGTGLVLTDPQGWDTWYGPISGTGAPGYLKYLKSKDELGQLKLFTVHDLHRAVSKLEFGVSYTDRYKRDGEGPSGFPVNANGHAEAPLPPQVGTTDMSFLGLGRIYAYDPLAAYDSGAFTFVPNTNWDYVAQRFDVEEKVTQLFAQVNLDTKLFGLPLTGDIGFRVINADQASKGYSRNGATNLLTLVKDGARYTNFAPDVNLKLTLDTGTYLRFSVARQVARPRMYDMRAAQAYGFDPSLATSTDLNHSPWSGSGGNPKLRPWLSDSVDLSLEKYFKENRGYVAFAAFDKHLLNYIYNQNGLESFGGYPTGGITPVLTQGIVTVPLNGTGGDIRGMELTVSLSSELISSIKGFGIVMGGAYTDSSVKPWGPTGGNAPIAGLSRKVANLTIYYESHGFAVRVSDRYRSSNRQYITTFGPPNRGGDVSSGGGFSVAQPENIIDAELSYSLQAGPAKGLTIYLQAYNLNDEPLVTYNNGDPRQVMNYQKYGASYSFGASYKF